MRIRVDPFILRQNSGSISGIGGNVNNVGQAVFGIAQGAPSNYGDFRAQVQAIGHEALARAQGLFSQVNDFSSQLQSWAHKFEAADMVGIAGFGNIFNGAQIPVPWSGLTGVPMDIINRYLMLGRFFGGTSYFGLLVTLLMGNNLFSGNSQVSGLPNTKPNTTFNTTDIAIPAHEQHLSTISPPKENTGIINPVQGVKPVLTQGTSGFSHTYKSGSPVAIDISTGTPDSAEIHNLINGKVVGVGPDKGWKDANGKVWSFGNYIKVLQDDGKVVLYGHLREQPKDIKLGDSIAGGQKIEMMGSTGTSTGTHLHLEFREAKYDQNGKYIGDANTLVDKGFDPFKYLEEIGVPKFW